MPRPRPAGHDAAGGGAPRRVPFPPGFPDVVVQQPWGLARPVGHPDYVAAKAGDTDAAFRFVQDVVTLEKVGEVRAMVGDRQPVIVPVHAEEASGRNKLPLAYAEELGEQLGLPVDDQIVQANRPQRTGKSNLYRMQNAVAFDGDVRPGQDYLMVDDHVSQGGTLAGLRSYIEQRGGHVVGATSLTAIPDGQMLAPSNATLAALRARLPGIDAFWQETQGYDIDGLTEHEPRYLARYNSLDALRNQLVAGRQTAGPGAAQGTPGAGQCR